MLISFLCNLVRGLRQLLSLNSEFFQSVLRYV